MPLSRRRFLAGTTVAAALALAPRLARAAPDGAFTARTSDGLSLTGDVRGDPAAPEILFVHGLRQSRLSWERQLADPALAGFRIARFDLRGHGDSSRPETPASYSDPDLWADDVAAAIEAAGLRRPVLVGWSLGGYVAGAYLRKHGGERIAGINLVDAVTRFSPDLLTPLAGTFATSASSHDLAERTAATAEFLAACFHQAPATAEFDRMLVVNGMTARAVNEGILQSRVADLEPVFAAYRGPILLTHGAHDRLVRLAMSERIRDLHAGATLSVFADSGHSPFYEEPERFNRELAAFVAAATRR